MDEIMIKLIELKHNVNSIKEIAAYKELDDKIIDELNNIAKNIETSYYKILDII